MMSKSRLGLLLCCLAAFACVAAALRPSPGRRKRSADSDLGLHRFLQASTHARRARAGASQGGKFVDAITDAVDAALGDDSEDKGTPVHTPTDYIKPREQGGVGAPARCTRAPHPLAVTRTRPIPRPPRRPSGRVPEGRGRGGGG